MEDFTEMWSQDLIDNIVHIGSGNGLLQNRWKLITWTNDDPLHWLIYESADRNDFMTSFALQLIKHDRCNQHLQVKYTTH